MAAPISLRRDFDGPMLRALALSERMSVWRRLWVQRLLATVGLKAVHPITVIP